MESDQHRSEWLAVGSAIFIGGIIVMAEWAFAVLSAAPENHLHFVNLILIVPGALIVVGFYVMIAAHVPSYPLFGRTRVRKAIERRREADYYLAQFLYIGNFYGLGYGDVDNEKVIRWYTLMREFVLVAWGVREHSALSAFPDKTDAQTMAFNISMRVTNLVERCHRLEVLEDFYWEPEPQWKTYVDELMKTDEFSILPKP
jgi:hypothetical protein